MLPLIAWLVFFLSTILGLPFLLGDESRGEAEFLTDLLSSKFPETMTIPALFRLVFGDLDPMAPLLLVTREDLDTGSRGLF